MNNSDRTTALARRVVPWMGPTVTLPAEALGV
jgi:hypothetical protein